MKASRRHFTLVEVLVVVALIGVLTGIGFGTYSYAMNSAREKSTRALFKRMEAALENCKTKFGYYPPSNSGDFTKVIFKLNTDGTVTEVDFGGNNAKFSANPSGSKEEQERQKSFIKEFLQVLDAESLKKNLQKDGTEYTLVDNWGGVVYYSYPGIFNKTSYDLLSSGPDGIFGEGGTPGNNPPTSLSKYKDSTSKEAVCDDIFNF